MLSLPAIAAMVAFNAMLFNPTPLAQQPAPLVTDQDTIIHHWLTREEVLVPDFMRRYWVINDRREKTT
jgi:hypothetical protein